MKKLSLFTVFFWAAIQLIAQPFKLSELIPFNPSASKGVLKNGMTYYVKSNSTPKNRAEMMLVVSAGSVSNSYALYAMNVSTDANRNVTSTASFNNWVSSSYNVTVGVTANYIIVCSK